MVLIHQNGASFYQFERLARFKDVRHGIFTRHFGYSRSPFESLNVTFGLGDENAHVEQNRRVVARTMGGCNLVCAQQVHGDEVLVLNSDGPDPNDTGERVLGTGDALVTDAAEKLLMIQLADCQSILLYDTVRCVVANIHSGWRGSIRNIAGKTVKVMQKRFQSDPAHIIAGIGPSIGPCCAEFVHYEKEIPEIYWSYKSATDHFDFWAVSRDQLNDAGVPLRHIEISHICTRCHTGLFFSYRGEGQTGRFASVIGIKG